MQSRLERRKNQKGNSLAPFIIGLAIVLLLRAFVFTTIQVMQNSMRETLHDGETIMLDKISYVFSEPKRYDIVVCRFSGRTENFVKRIIGLPGETIEIKYQTIHIDGKPLQDDTHGNGRPPSYNNGYRMVVPVGQYFVMGDNRANSQDSVELGTVKKDDILGRGVAVIWPLNRIHLLT